MGQLGGGPAQDRKETTNEVALADAMILSADVHRDFRPSRPDGNRHGNRPEPELQLLIGQRESNFGYLRQSSSNRDFARWGKSRRRQAAPST
jgi:hypothetical protein